MIQQAHAERAHALLGASKAEQWINCPPSARLQESIPDTRSEYAEEGTLAHELSEIKLRRILFPCDSKERKRLDKAMETIKKQTFSRQGEEILIYGPEMEDATQDYVELVIERYMEARNRSADAVILLEERLDYTEWVPEGFGTGDTVIIADGVLEVIDLKYGKGVPVSAIGNPQLRLYGLGAWFAYSYLYDIREIRITISQPRLDSVSTDSLSVEDLLNWAETIVKPAAELAFKGEGKCRAGDHCKWCKVKGNCRARADENMEALEYEFKEPALLTNEEIGPMLYIADRLKTWAKDIEDYAFGQALKGENIPSWKLVEGRSKRIITDQEKLVAAFLTANIDKDKYLKPQELYGITDLEKKIGKKEFKALAGDLVIKPPGKPVLVPETDKREELNSVDGDFAGEEFEV